MSIIINFGYWWLFPTFKKRKTTFIFGLFFLTIMVTKFDVVKLFQKMGDKLNDLYS